MRIAKNRTKLVEKILQNAEDIHYYYDDDMTFSQGKFENQEKAKSILKDELYKWKFAHLSCDNGGRCIVHVTSNKFLNFNVNPSLIAKELQREQQKRVKRQDKAEEYREKLGELGVASLPKGMSFDQLKEKLDRQRQKSDQISSQYSPQPPEPTITISIDGTCDEWYQFTNQNQIWDNPQEPSMDSFGNRLARRINKSLMSKCPEKQYSQGMEKLGFKKHLKPTD